MKSLLADGHQLSAPDKQLQIIGDRFSGKHSSFASKLREGELFPLTATGVEIFQVNIGKMCNQTCKHCHVDAGPDRKEMMSRTDMEKCIELVRQHPAFHTIDITGGAPEMHPEFSWFVEELSALKRKIIVRCNLTIIVANKKYHDLPQFYADHGIEVVSSLPYYSSSRTDAQRGEGVFTRSIEALKMLNEVGYGTNPALKLNLVYNPSGAFLPASQSGLELEFKKKLNDQFGIVFNHLYTITNLPISRFLDYLITSGNHEAYMEKLISGFNIAAARQVMCRNTISISWDGFLYDCDFNQMLQLKVSDKDRAHISSFDTNYLNSRDIVINEHCFGCTAGAGSSCGGTVA